MKAEDLDGVVQVARLAFPDHFEERSCFAERLLLYPRGCFTLDHGGFAAGYLIAYPWIWWSAPPLDSLIGALPEGELLYLHDLALHLNARGQNWTKPIVERLVSQARGDGWKAIALVSVNQSAAFWEKLGFARLVGRGLAGKLESYGANARYMVRKI